MDGSGARLDYGLEYLFTSTARVLAPQSFGRLPGGSLAFYPVAEARLEGPRLRGRVLPGSGGDWLGLREDGVPLIDVRVTVQTDDGALIYASYQGIGAAPHPPTPMPIRAMARYQSGHPAYRWLNDLLCVQIGQSDVEKLELRYDVYALR